MEKSFTMEQLINIGKYILDSFIHIWPYLLITIPLSAGIRFLGVSSKINKIFSKSPYVSILLATIVGAFSPFCSCGVIPVITSLLLGGVPIAPVMSFWIASPSMDPEIFFLSTAALGWNLAVWRLISTFLISFLAGVITHLLFRQGYLGEQVLRIKREVVVVVPTQYGQVQCCVETDALTFDHPGSKGTDSQGGTCGCNSSGTIVRSYRNLGKEIFKATSMVVRFMALAFLLNALIKFYFPQEWIKSVLSGNSSISVIVATLIGIPAYTSNLSALPLVSGMLELGMNKGAALSFLIAGATTTLPAMIAVWGITTRRIFLLYLAYSLIGALLAGFLFNIVNALA